MDWDLISDVILVTAFAILGALAMLGLIQLISRRSLKKVDHELLMFPIPLAIMAIVYVVFEKFLILNTRPNGSGEPSFPSTHVMITATIFFMVAVVLPRYIKSKVLCAMFDIIMLILLVLVCTGRILANMHWPTDVAGGVVFASIFAAIYYLLIKPKKKEKK